MKNPRNFIPPFLIAFGVIISIYFLIGFVLIDNVSDMLESLVGRQEGSVSGDISWILPVAGIAMVTLGFWLRRRWSR